MKKQAKTLSIRQKLALSTMAEYGGQTSRLCHKRTLQALVRRGLVTKGDDPITKWALTPAGYAAISEGDGDHLRATKNPVQGHRVMTPEGLEPSTNGLKGICSRR